MIIGHIIVVILVLLFCGALKKYKKMELVGLAIFTLLFSIFVDRYSSRFKEKIKDSEKVSKKEENGKGNSDSKNEEDVINGKNQINDKNVISEKLVNVEKSNKFDVDRNRSIIEKNRDSDLNEIILENDEIIAHFSMNGGCISKIVLKKYKNHKGENVTLIDRTNVVNFELVNLGINTYDLKFLANRISDSKIVFSLMNPSNIVISYELNKKNQFEILQTIRTTENSEINFTFNNILLQNEYNLDDCKNKSSINYFENNSMKSLYFSNDKKTKEINNCRWVSFKQKFFTSGFSSENKMSGEIYIKGTDKGVNESNLFAKLTSSNNYFKIKYFFGPNKYQILKSFTGSFEDNIYLGIPVVSSLNKYIILPFSEYVRGWASSIFVLLILVILIKLLILPINFKIYIITKRIRLINEIINILKEKYKNNQQKLVIEQINIFKEFGVNPLSILLYNIIQFPFIIAIYNFIPIEMMFRHSKFLWCNDISSNDYIFNLGFNIPFYGSQVSLSSILMGLTMLVYSFFSEASPVDMKTDGENSKIRLHHIFIMIFMVCMSVRFCCALNIYYIFFNIITLITQVLFSRYINDDKFQQMVNVKMNQIR